MEFDSKRYIEENINYVDLSQNFDELGINGNLDEDMEVDKEPIIQKAWPKKLTYNDYLLYDLYVVAKYKADKLLDLGTYKEVDETIDVEVDQVDTHENEIEVLDTTKETIMLNGDDVALLYDTENDRFILEYNIEESGTLGKSGNTSYKAFIIFTITDENDILLDKELSVLKTDRGRELQESEYFTIFDKE